MPLRDPHFMTFIGRHTRQQKSTTLSTPANTPPILSFSRFSQQTPRQCLSNQRARTTNQRVIVENWSSRPRHIRPYHHKYGYLGITCALSKASNKRTSRGCKVCAITRCSIGTSGSSEHVVFLDWERTGTRSSG